MNKYTRRILLDPASINGGGGTTPPAGTPPPGGTPPLNDFVKSLPADLQSEKSLHNMDSSATLAKSYIHAQKMIGAKRLPAPEPTWGDKEWGTFYDEVGRPKTAGDYQPPKIEGVEIKTDDPRWKQTAQALHDAGLTQKQAEKVLTRYWNDQVEVQKLQQTTVEQQRLQAEAALKTEWGDKYDVNINIAKSVVAKFGTDDLMTYINEKGGNDPRLIKTLAKIGEAMLEDKSRGGSAAEGLQVTDATRATQEINRLKIDKDFQLAMTKKDHPGHKAAVQQWLNLHKITSPGKQVEAQ